MSWRAAFAAATLGALARWRWWLLALATFLVRGGVLLVVPPVFMVPTPSELANLLSPSLLGTGFGGPTPLLVAVVAVTSLGLLGLVVLTTVVGTWLDLALVEAEQADAELEARSSSRSPRHRIALIPAVGVRLAAHVPTAIVVALAAMALEVAATAELISPEGTGPLYVRILLRAPAAPAAVVVTWLIGEAWGGLAMRRLGPDPSVLRALRLGLRDLLRPSAIATAIATTVVVAVPLLALWFAAGRAFSRVMPLLVDPGDLGLLVVGVGLLVGTWAAGLWLLGIGLAWRSAAWTAEALRHA
jgi:hypothetical protein